MASYREEQFHGHQLVLRHLGTLDDTARGRLQARVAPYLDFRRRTEEFLQAHFSPVCTDSCYRSQRSACCSKDGIITFFGDLVVNALVSPPERQERIMERLGRPHEDFKCIYLASGGCLWQVKPIVCEMFLCDPALDRVFGPRPDLRTAWEGLQAEKKRYTWPDRPVLFDDLESMFMTAGLDSPLMYLHHSPGLLRVKRMAGFDATLKSLSSGHDQG